LPPPNTACISWRKTILAPGGQVSVPLYGLSGLFDPVVPWFLGAPVVKGNCPG